ncbi:hypothetical protein V8C43DRAFT_282349 [Trichoderma afarasin]
MPTLTCIQQESKNAGRHGAKKGGEIPCNTSLIYFPSMTTVQIPLLAQAPQGSQTTRALQSGRQTQQRSAVLVSPAAAPQQTKKEKLWEKEISFWPALDDSYTGRPGQVDYFERRRREASGEDGSRRQRTASRRLTGHSIKQSFSSAGRTRTHGFRSRLRFMYRDRHCARTVCGVRHASHMESQPSRVSAPRGIRPRSMIAHLSCMSCRLTTHFTLPPKISKSLALSIDDRNTQKVSGHSHRHYVQRNLHRRHIKT